MYKSLSWMTLLLKICYDRVIQKNSLIIHHKCSCHTSREDIVWDEYHSESLKAESRSKRGKGIRRRVESSTAITANWKVCLRIDENKVELFSFLATTVVASIYCKKQTISTCRTEVFCNQSGDLSGLAPCTHEEADTRREIRKFPYVQLTLMR